MSALTALLEAYARMYVGMKKIRQKRFQDFDSNLIRY